MKDWLGVEVDRVGWVMVVFDLIVLDDFVIFVLGDMVYVVLDGKFVLGVVFVVK